MQSTAASTFADPVRLATVALSLMQHEAWESLAAVSSIYVKDRYTLLGGSPGHTTTPLSLFVWQQDSAPHTLEMTDVALHPPSPSSALFRVWDEDTLQAAVPFGFGSGSGSAGAMGGSGVAVILLLHSPGRWVYHNLMGVDHGWDVFAKGWCATIDKAREAFALSSREAADASEPSPTDDDQYWNSYAVVGDNVVSRKRSFEQSTLAQDENTEDDYWNSY